MLICEQMWSDDDGPFEGAHYKLARTLNSPQSLSRPRPFLMIGGSGERKTLRLVAQHADACNIFARPEAAHKLDVLRAHCEREGRDYDAIEKTTILSVERLDDARRPARGACAGCASIGLHGGLHLRQEPGAAGHGRAARVRRARDRGLVALQIEGRNSADRDDGAFAFFADAFNLEAITPPWLRFRILTPRPIAMGEGALIDYRLSLHGVPCHWHTRIDLRVPGRRFVDRQVSGPFSRWEHTHTFEARPCGTLIRDLVVYRMPLGPLGGIAGAC